MADARSKSEGAEVLSRATQKEYDLAMSSPLDKDGENSDVVTSFPERERSGDLGSAIPESETHLATVHVNDGDNRSTLALVQALRARIESDE